MEELVKKIRDFFLMTAGFLVSTLGYLSDKQNSILFGAFLVIAVILLEIKEAIKMKNESQDSKKIENKKDVA